MSDTNNSPNPLNHLTSQVDQKPNTKANQKKKIDTIYNAQFIRPII